MSEMPDGIPVTPVKRALYYDKVYSDGLIETLREAIEDRDKLIREVYEMAKQMKALREKMAENEKRFNAVNPQKGSL